MATRGVGLSVLIAKVAKVATSRGVRAYGEGEVRDCGAIAAKFTQSHLVAGVW